MCGVVSPWCLWSANYVTGIVDYQIGHHAKCRMSTLKLMQEDSAKVNMPGSNNSDVPQMSTFGDRGAASASTPSSSTQATPSTATSTQSSCAGLVDGTCLSR